MRLVRYANVPSSIDRALRDAPADERVGAHPRRGPRRRGHDEVASDAKSGAILATIDKVGGVDEIWFNPGDSRFYVAARDMPGGPVMGVIDAKSNQWLQNVATNTNSHSLAVDPSNNHVFVPLQSGGPCGTQSANGCVAVYAQQ